MIPLEYEKWSPWPAVWWMAGVVVAVVVVVFIIDVITPDKLDPPKGQRIIPGAEPLKEVPLPPQPPVEDDLFPKVEEFRRDFDGEGRTVGLKQHASHFDCSSGRWCCLHGSVDGESVFQGS